MNLYMDNNKYIYTHKQIGFDEYEIFFTSTNITNENETVYIRGEVGYYQIFDE